MLPTVDLAMMILERWHSASRLTNDAYHHISSLAHQCADELGDELPDTAISHSLVTAWLRAKDNVEARGWAWKEDHLYLGEPG